MKRIKMGLLTTCLAIWMIGDVGFAQVDDVPVAPANTPSTVTEDASSDEDIEVLARGPVHEAFASQINYDPKPGMIVSNTPPEQVDEIPPDYKPDGENVIWIPGYWGFDDQRKDYVWISGVWRTPPAGRRWVPGYWNELMNDRDYQWVSGFWASSERRKMDYSNAPPESLENGPSVSAPTNSHFWVPGVWLYRGTNYRWRAGHWVRYRPNYVYIPSRWMWTPGGYVFVDGYWDYQMSARGVMFAPVVMRAPIMRYRPSIVMDIGRFHMHWFVRPRYGHYYFGDYYDARYQQHHHIYSHHHFHLNMGYDPFFAYNHVHYRHHHGISYLHHSSTWHNYFSSHPLHRPAHTFGMQLSIGRNYGERYFGMSIYARHIDRFRVQDDLHRNFVRVGTQYRNASVNQSASYTRLAYERHRIENGKLATGSPNSVQNSNGIWTMPQVQRGTNVTIGSAQRHVRITTPTVGAGVVPPKAAPGTSNKIVTRPTVTMPRPTSSYPSVTRPFTRPSSGFSGNYPTLPTRPRVTIGGSSNGGSGGLPTRPSSPRPSTPSVKPSTSPRPSASPRPSTPSPRPSVSPRPSTPSPRPSASPRPSTPSPRPSVSPRPSTPSPRPSASPRPSTPSPRPKK